MDGIIALSLAKKFIAKAMLGIKSIEQVDNKIVITTKDDTKFSVTISSPFTPLMKKKLESFSDDLSKITIDDNNYLYVDGEKFAKISDIEFLDIQILKWSVVGFIKHS